MGEAVGIDYILFIGIRYAIDCRSTFLQEAAELEEWAKQAQSFQNVFGANLTRYPELDDVVQDVTIKKGMWEAMVEVRRVRDGSKELEPCVALRMWRVDD